MTDSERHAREWYAVQWPMLYGAQAADYERRVASLAALLEQVRAEEYVAAEMRKLDFIAELADAFEKDGRHFSAATIHAELKRAHAEIRARSESKEND